MAGQPLLYTLMATMFPVSPTWRTKANSFSSSRLKHVGVSWWFLANQTKVGPGSQAGQQNNRAAAVETSAAALTAGPLSCVLQTKQAGGRVRLTQGGRRLRLTLTPSFP